MNKRKKEIIGILLVFLSIFILISQLSYNPAEEPTISPEVAIDNIFGILGVFIAHYLIKNFLGWGSLVLPIIIGLSGITLFLQNGLKQFSRHFTYLILMGILVSVWISVLEFQSTNTMAL